MLTETQLKSRLTSIARKYPGDYLAYEEAKKLVKLHTACCEQYERIIKHYCDEAGL